MSSYSATKRSRGLRALQIWCQRVTSSYEPRIHISNMSSSFRNGLAFCAIIHHFRPDLIPHFDTLKPENILENNRLAFNIAEEKLDIPALLDPQDMVDFEPDKFSVVTYVSQFYHMFKDADNSCKSSPNPSVRQQRILNHDSNSLSESSSSDQDSLLLSNSDDSDVTLSSPIQPKIIFNHADLVAKYGEEIFSMAPSSSNKKKKDNDDDVGGLCRKFVSKAVIAEEKES